MKSLAVAIYLNRLFRSETKRNVISDPLPEQSATQEDDVIVIEWH